MTDIDDLKQLYCEECKTARHMFRTMYERFYCYKCGSKLVVKIVNNEKSQA